MKLISLPEGRRQGIVINFVTKRETDKNPNRLTKKQEWVRIEDWKIYYHVNLPTYRGPLRLLNSLINSLLIHFYIILYIYFLGVSIFINMSFH